MNSCNLQSWSMAMTEAFYTWGLLGASAMQMASHNRRSHLLHKDTNIVTAVTFAVLILSAFLANTCSQLLLAHGYRYTPSSFGELKLVLATVQIKCKLRYKTWLLSYLILQIFWDMIWSLKVRHSTSVFQLPPLPPSISLSFLSCRCVMLLEDPWCGMVTAITLLVPRAKN